jgi:hypothetical protein
MEKNVSPAERGNPTTTACILDGRNLVHKLNGENLTFEELSDRLLATVLHMQPLVIVILLM